MHPYIRRRNGLEPVTYDHPVMERSLAKTLGIPLFQEQLMQLAVDVAGFDAGEADQLRRAMGAKRSSTKMEKLKGRLYDGMRDPARHHRRRGRPDLRAAARLRQLRVRRVARAVLRRAGLLLLLAETAPPGRVLRRAAPRAADGVLLTAVAGRRRPPARGDGAPAGHQRLRGAGRPGTRDRTATPAVRLGLAGIRTIGTELAEQIVAAGRADRVPDAGRADQGGHPDHRAGRGAGHRGCAGRAARGMRPRRGRQGPAAGAVGGRCGGRAERAGTLAGQHGRAWTPRRCPG